MNIDRKSRLRDIANAGTAARRVLDHADLDYCCEGGWTLGEACDASSVDLVSIESELRAVAPEIDAWEEREISAVLDSVLTKCHPRTRRLLSEATAAAVALCATNVRARPLADALGTLGLHVLKQMHEEEESLFARVRALADARMGRGPYPAPPFRTIGEHGDRLRKGHRRTHDYIRLVRTLLGNLDGVGGEELTRRIEAALSSLTEQMHLENNELLPRARDLEPSEFPASV